MTHKQLIVDRFEDEWAVLEYGLVTFNVPKELLPPNTQPGDVLNIQLAIDEATTNQRKDQIHSLFERLKKK